MKSIVTGEKRKISREKGITLIALVVTIIVLLILAGVSIQMLTGQNGILKRAQEASDKTKRAEIIEEVQMEIYDKQVGQEGNIYAKDLHEILEEYFENVPELGEDGTWEDYPNNFKEPLVSKEDKKIEVEIGEIYKGSLSIKTGIVPKEVVGDLSKYIGAYVNYEVELDGDPSTPDWRILYAQNAEGKNRIYLIAADYVPTDNAALVDAMGEGTTKAMMKPSTESGYSNLCVNWTNSLPNDLQAITLENWKEIFKDGSYELDILLESSRCAARLRETTNWTKFAEGTGGEYAIGGPTAHMWCEAWNTIVNTDDGYAKINVSKAYSYGYKYIGTSEDDAMYMNGTTSGLELEKLNKLSSDDTYSLFFPHTTYSEKKANGKTGDCYGYWLSSTAACNAIDLMHVDYRGFVRGLSYRSSFGVRPLVCMTSSIRLIETGKTQKGKPVYDIVQ